MEQLTVNISGTVRRVNVLGEEYAIAPVSLIVPGVLNGSRGPLYYPLEEIRNTFDLWNDIPIVVNHPEDEKGNPISAKEEGVFDKQGIGFIRSSRINGKLTADAWFSVNRLLRVDQRLLQMLNQSTPIELSTGLGVDLEDAPENSVYNGKPYTHVARNYRPDHLAILPDQKGACSLSDGCGVLVNQLAHSEVHDRLMNALRQKYPQRNVDEGPTVWIEDIFDKEVIYRNGDSLYRIGYTKDKESVALNVDEQPTEVVRKVHFVIKNEEAAMPDKVDKKKEGLIDSLIANCDCWAEEDREALRAFSTERLTTLNENLNEQTKLAEVVNAATAGFENEQGKVAFNTETGKWDVALKEPQPTKEKKEVENKETKTEDPKKPQTAEEWFSTAPPEIRDAVRNAMEVEANQKRSLVDQLVANVEDDGIRKNMAERLFVKPLDELRELAIMIPKPKQDEYRAPSYVGAAAVGNYDLQDKPRESLDIPVIDWETA